MCLYCQYAKNYLANIYDVDLNVNIKPNYYLGLSKEDVLVNFIYYREAVQKIFSNIIDNGTNYFSPEEKDNDTILIPMTSIFGVLYVIGFYGTLQNDNIIVDTETFKEKLQKVKRTYLNIAIDILKDSGFSLNGDVWGNGGTFSFNYQANHNVIFGLHDFSRTCIWDINSTVSASGDPLHFILLDNKLYGYKLNESKPFDTNDLIFYKR